MHHKRLQETASTNGANHYVAIHMASCAAPIRAAPRDATSAATYVAICAATHVATFAEGYNEISAAIQGATQAAIFDVTQAWS